MMSFSQDRPILVATVFIALPILLTIAFQRILSWQSSHYRGLPLPPGPKKRFFTGNLHNIPTAKPWESYKEWKKQYGDIIHLTIYGQHTVILNKKDDAIALFEKRSKVYSDRPLVPMIDLMGWGFNAAFMHYTNKWRRHRRLFQQCFRKDASVNYRPIQKQKVYDMLHGLLESPEDFMGHYRTLAAAIAMSALYGHDIAPKNDYFVDLAEQAVGKLSESVFPGATIVNALPVLRHLPAWFPGAGFKRFGDKTKILTDQMQNVPYNFVKKNLAAGNAPPSIVSDLLENHALHKGTAEEEEIIKEVTATAYAGGADTTVSAIGTLFCAMVLHPEAQRKAQQEIDRVVGTNRLPEFEDRSSLPYVEAVYREIMRWRPVLPLNVAHATTRDDVYKGYIIPKGASVISNLWAMAHDESIYEKPELFLPERFFTKDGELNDDDTILAFGFGRRICVGKHFANGTLWMTIVSTLATFNIQKAKDANGREIPIAGDYTDGLVSHPLPYKCSITPRSEAAKRLILEAPGTKRA